jgi:hypothetical protein
VLTPVTRAEVGALPLGLGLGALNVELAIERRGKSDSRDTVISRRGRLLRLASVARGSVARLAGEDGGEGASQGVGGAVGAGDARRGGAGESLDGAVTVALALVELSAELAVDQNEISRLPGGTRRKVADRVGRGLTSSEPW